MAYTSDQLTTLQAAIASGQLSVTYKDRSVTYRSLDDMIKLEAKLRAELGSNSKSFASRGVSVSTTRDLE